MDYVNTLQQNKRRREGDLDHWDRSSKRVCNGLGACVQVACVVGTGSPMDTRECQQQISPPNSSNFSHHLSTTVLAVPPVTSGQHGCPRCMAGESGHINHIMQRY